MSTPASLFNLAPVERLVTQVRALLPRPARGSPADAARTASPGSPGSPAGLEVRAVGKSFGPVAVLHDISFHVPAGQFVTLLGPSGCGKTTLLRVIAGLELAESGRVVLDGQSIDHLPANRRPINTVFQHYALFPHLNVHENVAFGLRSRGIDAAEVAARLQPTLEMLQLGDLGQRYPHQLSGGQKQRVALARALVNQPAVLLLDEPMSALDAKLRAEVQLELRRLQQRLGRTFILVTHDQNEALTVSDRILVMRAGRIEQQGAPAEVYERPRSRFVAEFLGAANLIPATRSNGVVRTELGDLAVRHPAGWDGGTLAIRPERIRIAGGAPQQNGVRVRVREVVYRGSHQEVFVEPGGLRVHAPATQPVRVGDLVWLELPRECVEVLVD